MELHRNDYKRRCDDGSLRVFMFDT